GLGAIAPIPERQANPVPNLRTRVCGLDVRADATNQLLRRAVDDRECRSTSRLPRRGMRRDPWRPGADRIWMRNRHRHLRDLARASEALDRRSIRFDEGPKNQPRRLQGGL